MCTVMRWVGRNVIDYLKLLDAEVTRGLTLYPYPCAYPYPCPYPYPYPYSSQALTL